MDNFDYNTAWGVSLSRSESILDGMSTTCSITGSPPPFDRAPGALPRCSSCFMKSELSQFEEKFKLRESILLGADVIAELAGKIPALEGMRSHSDYIQAEMMLANPQNVCVWWGSTEQELITEYMKTFAKISDAWLGVRNCFGQDGRCMGKLCCLDMKDLSKNYVAWMHSSRNLLQSIAAGLRKISNNVKKPPGFQLDPPQIGDMWDFSPKSPCQCSLKSETKVRPCPEPAGRFNPPAPLYPGPPPAPPSLLTGTTDGDYITPSSYHIPRNNLTTTYRKENVVKSKSDIVTDSPNSKDYLITFTKTAVVEDDDVDGILCKAPSYGSVERQKTLGDSKSDTDGYIKDGVKKNLTKKAWTKRRRPADQPGGFAAPELMNSFGQLKISSRDKNRDEDDSSASER